MVTPSIRVPVPASSIFNRADCACAGRIGPSSPAFGSFRAGGGLSLHSFELISYWDADNQLLVNRKLFPHIVVIVHDRYFSCKCLNSEAGKNRMVIPTLNQKEACVATESEIPIFADLILTGDD